MNNFTRRGMSAFASFSCAASRRCQSSGPFLRSDIWTQILNPSPSHYSSIILLLRDHLMKKTVNSIIGYLAEEHWFCLINNYCRWVSALNLEPCTVLSKFLVLELRLCDYCCQYWCNSSNTLLVWIIASIGVISLLPLLNLHFTVLIEFKRLYVITWRKTYFPLCRLFTLNASLSLFPWTMFSWAFLSFNLFLCFTVCYLDNTASPLQM